MIRNIWILIAKKLNDEATADELQELEALLGEADTDVLVAELEAIFSKNPGKAFNEAFLEQKWRAFDTRLDSLLPAPNYQPAIVAPERNTRRLILKLSTYAAVFILMFTGAWLLLKPQEANQGETSIAAPRVGVSKIILPDGSSVWLNSGSRITYKNNAKTSCREVSLIGEAYFDVVKDAQHPFIVSTHTFKIRVLGTAFNVRAYTADAISEATLLRGRIELTLNKNPEKKFILKPSERLTIQNPELQPARKHISIQKPADNRLLVELSTVKERKTDGLSADALWTKEVIDFDNTDFTEIAEMMQHKYNVSFVFKNDDIKKLKFTGKFRNETVEQAMKELQATAVFKYRIDEDQITVF